MDDEPSKAAKKNKKKRAKNKTTDTEKGGAMQLGAADILPLLKEEFELAKQAKDHARAGKLRDQLWVLNDLVAGVRTDIPEEEYNEIIRQLPIATAQAEEQEKMIPVETASTGSLTTGERRLKTLRKKLDQVETLKDKQRKGEKLEQNQLKKLETEKEIRDEIEELEELLRTVI